MAILDGMTRKDLRNFLLRVTGNNQRILKNDWVSILEIHHSCSEKNDLEKNKTEAGRSRRKLLP